MDKQQYNRASQVRQGEELDLNKLVPWLHEHVADCHGTPDVQQYSGGASNWTYKLKFDVQELVLRRPPAGTKAKGAHNMQREYELQHALKPVFSKVPRMLAFCDDSSVIGSDFYVMQKLEGMILRKNLPKGVTISTTQQKLLCQSMLDQLVELHNIDYKSAKLTEFGKGDGYVERQISGWNTRYQKAQTWNVPKAHRIMRWLEDNIPTQQSLCMTHNDFRLDNLVLDPQNPTDIVGVLDWELATIGDPLMDLGNTLAYWVEAKDDFFAKATRRQPSHMPGMMTRQEVIDYYCQKSEIASTNLAFYQVYGLFRLAAIVQQIYYRYHHKQTRNPAFKHLWVFVHYLLHRCRKLIP